MLYIINYDLRTPGKDYTGLFNTIASIGPHCRALRSCWYVQSERSAQQIKELLHPNIDYNDKLLVSAVIDNSSVNIFATA